MKFKKLSRNLLLFIFIFGLVSSLCSCSYYDLIFDMIIPENEGDLIVSYLDVGQGDSIFVELPNSETMLIDAGVSGVGDDIAEYIEYRGYDRIDYLVATHPHADHIGSMEYIVDNFSIGEIYMTEAVTTTKTFENLLEAIYDNEYKLTTAVAGDTIISDERFSVNILGPEYVDEKNLNNSSIVISIDYLDNSFLFVGDAEKKELESIKYDMSADVLKVGHHGSRTSTTESFLDAVNPQYAIISCGENNDYGHPHRETLNILEEYDVEVLRTDINGTIAAISDGFDIKFVTSK